MEFKDSDCWNKPTLTLNAADILWVLNTVFMTVLKTSQMVFFLAELVEECLYNVDISNTPVLFTGVKSGLSN